MPISIRPRHEKLLLPASCALRSTTSLTRHLQQCQVRGFTSTAVQKLPEKRLKTPLEQRLARQNRVKNSRVLYTTKASHALSPDSQNQIQSQVRNSQDGELERSGDLDIVQKDPASFKSRRHLGSFTPSRYSNTQKAQALAPTPKSYARDHGEPEIASRPVRKGLKPLIRKHHAQDHGERNPALGVKYLYRKAIPLDPTEIMPDMAQFRSKRENEAAIEEFLGVKRTTKHEIVDGALKRHLRQARAIHRKKKGEREIYAWSHSLESDGSHDENGDGLQGDKISKVQSAETPTKHFDLLDAIGSGLRANNADKDAGSAFEANRDSAHHDGAESNFVDKDFDIDWNNLPLSPLMHQGLIKARTKFRGAKPLYSDATDYNKQSGWKIANDYLATMLASPIRACRLTYARLPKDFLLTTQAIQHPETGQVWELPKDLNPQDLTKTPPSSDPVPADSSDLPLMNDSKVQPINSADSAQDSSSMTETQNVSEQSSSVPASSNINSYMLSTQVAVQMISDLPPMRYPRMIPHRWRDKLGDKLAANIHWRNDMPSFIHSLMQRQITDQLRILSSSAGGGLVQACASLDGLDSQKIESLPSLKTCAILCFGTREQPSILETSFYSMVNAIASSQAFKGEVLDDLLQTSQNMGWYSHLVRIQMADGKNILVFDMTRLLNPNFAQSLSDIGYDQAAYYIADEPGSRFLRKRLWWLAHYLKQKSTI